MFIPRCTTSLKSMACRSGKNESRMPGIGFFIRACSVSTAVRTSTSGRLECELRITYELVPNSVAQHQCARRAVLNFVACG